MLDTARFRALLAERLGVDSQHIHGYVVGEHGDSEVLTWSLASVGVMPLRHFCVQQGIDLDADERRIIDDNVRNAAYSIIEGKGATYYGIGGALAHIVDVILRDQRAILTICSPMVEVAGVQNVTVSLPHLVGGQGILATLPLPLDEKESAALEKSAQTIRGVIDDLEAHHAS